MSVSPKTPFISNAKVVFIGGINSTGYKGWQLIQDGYNCTVAKTPSQNVTSILAKILPVCLSGIQSYLSDLKISVLNSVKMIQPDIVVGVSQGGAVAMSLAQQEWKGTKLVLVAPAWKTFGVAPIVPRDTVILHGIFDWIVPIKDSITLQHKNNCKLVQVNDNHHLSKSYDIILREVDNISILTGWHKPEVIYRKELEDYAKLCQEWKTFYSKGAI